jgi:hypothetical protein
MTATSSRFLPGVNYPWSRFNGRNNYGCDFGRNIWGSHAGVSAHRDEVAQDFAGVASAGAKVARWFVFTDGRSGIHWNADGTFGGTGEHLFDDLDAALAIAGENGVQLCLVLFDYLWMHKTEVRDSSGRLIFSTHPELFTTEAGRQQLLTGLIEPMLERYGTGGPQAHLGRHIHSFDVINEPDWVTAGLQPSRDRNKVPKPMTLDDLRHLVRGIADRVHQRASSLVTVGGGRARFASEWDRDEYGLDFIQVHLYLDTRDPGRDLDLRTVDCSALRVSKPVLIGEFPGNGHFQHPPTFALPTCSMEEYLAFAESGGYLGAWPWSFKGVDGFGAVNGATLLAWVAQHTGAANA